AVDVGLRLGVRDFRLPPTDELEPRVVGAYALYERRVEIGHHLRLHRERQRHVDGLAHIRAEKFRRRHADHGDRLAVHAETCADGTWIAAEAPLPEPVAQN